MNRENKEKRDDSFHDAFDSTQSLDYTSKLICKSEGNWTSNHDSQTREEKE